MGMVLSDPALSAEQKLQILSVIASGKNGILINIYLPKSTIIKGISGFAIPPFDDS
jgi:hypothetical protein